MSMFKIGDLCDVVTTACAFITLMYVIKNSSKHDENIIAAFDEFAKYCCSLQEMHSKSLKLQKELYDISIKPYFVSENCRIDEQDGVKKIAIKFRNKGRGIAFNVIVEGTKADVLGEYNSSVKQCEPAENVAVLENDTTSFLFDLQDISIRYGIHMCILLNFYDIQGKEYKEKFEIVAHENGTVHNMIFPKNIAV